MTRPLFTLWLLVAFAFGALGMSIVLIHPAFAQDCSTYDAVFARAVETGMKPFAIPAANLAKFVEDVEAVTGDNYGTVSRGFLLFVPGKLVVGLEHDGCLYQPIEIVSPKADGAA